LNGPTLSAKKLGNTRPKIDAALRMESCGSTGMKILSSNVHRNLSHRIKRNIFVDALRQGVYFVSSISVSLVQTML
jgi:hypothetical protein